MVRRLHVVLILFCHLNHIFKTCTSNLINHDFIVLQDRILYREQSFHLVYTNVNMVTWSALVLRTADLQIISPVFNHDSSNLMLVIINLVIITL